MPNLSVKDVPEAWAEALRQRAARNHRSLQGELMQILEAAVHTAPAAQQVLHLVEPTGGAARHGRPGAMLVGQRRGTKTIAQISAELDAKYPEPVTGVDLGRDIIRAERDAR
jgi:hypothetical protein